MSECLWASGSGRVELKMVPSLPLLFCELSESVKEDPDRKKKRNISKIKHHSYKVLNLQVHFVVLVLTHRNLSFWAIFCKANVIFITGMPFFLLLPPENEFLQIFWTINAHNNEEFTMKYWKKLYVKFVEGFSSLFASRSPGTVAVWT